MADKNHHQFRTCVSAIFPWDAILEIHIFGGFSGGPGDSPEGEDDGDDDDDDDDHGITLLTPPRSPTNRHYVVDILVLTIDKIPKDGFVTGLHVGGPTTQPSPS